MPQYCPACGNESSDNAKFCAECGIALSEDSSLISAVIEDRYEILEVVKSGAMGEVYKARDIRLENTVALKKMLSSFSAGEEKEYALERFKEEARLLSRLHHGGLPKVIDSFTTGESGKNGTAHYLVMTFIEGKDLEAVMAGRGQMPLPVNEAVSYFRQILLILEYLHSHTPPVIYRDMKPSNIMESNGKIFLVDFGIARLFTPQAIGTLIGTPGYAAPEQYKGFSEPRSDLYSLAAVMHYLLTGSNPQDTSRPPFSFESPSKLNIYVPEYLDRIIMNLLEFECSKRANGAGEVLSMLDGTTVTPAAAISPESDCDELFDAIKKNDRDKISTILMKGISPDGRDSEGFTPLHRAAGSGDIETMMLLLDSGANIEAKENNGATPLAYAVLFEHKEATMLLLSRRARIDSRDASGCIPLHVAADENLPHMIELLLKEGAKSEMKNFKGFTALHIASDRGNIEAIRQLHISGARLNARSSRGLTPLHLAARQGHTEAAELLLERGASVNARASHNATPLHLAAQNGHREVAEILISSGALITARESRYGGTPLHWAAGEGQQDLVKLLVSKGAEINLKDRYGRTPLHKAAMEGTVDIAQFLVSLGADVKLKSAFGRTPLHLAAKAGKKEMAEFLIAQGALVDERDWYGKTPLFTAVSEGHKDLIELLISKGADVNATTIQGFMSRFFGTNPLKAAQRENQREIADILYSHGARDRKF
ncbi:MAG: ankyrin repeat domain-containing protein [Candidatus Xenobiia bacterium LiM19]